jgi:hypothetical protein
MEVWSFGKAVAFFQTVVSLFQVRIYLRYDLKWNFLTQVPEFCQTLPTYTFLSDAGIEPSTVDQHTLEDFISALRNGSGVRNPPDPNFWFLILSKLGIYARNPLLWEDGQSNFLVLQLAGIYYRWKLHPDWSVIVFIFWWFYPYLLFRFSWSQYLPSGTTPLPSKKVGFEAIAAGYLSTSLELSAFYRRRSLVYYKIRVSF